MPRHFWISASIAILVAAFALFAMALPRLVALDDSEARTWEEASAQQQVETYSVPPARGEMIRETLKTVLFVYQQGVQPLGQANLAAPDKLVVTAPVRMHASIRRAIEELAEGKAVPGSSRSTAVELWLVEAGSGTAGDDSLLAPAKAVLDAARRQFGHKNYRLLERTMTIAPLDGHRIRLLGAGSEADLELVAQGNDAVEAQIELDLREQGRMSSFSSRLVLPPGQWQLVGLLPDAVGNSPERLLLLRQTPAAENAAPEQ